MKPARPPFSAPACPPGRGFTAIELLVVIAIAGVLMGVAAPSFQAIIQRNRVASETNAFIGDLQFARAEAIKEGQSVTLCASTNGTSCATTSTGLQGGWIVFSDANGNNTVDGTDVVLKQQKAWTSTDTFASDNSTLAHTFNRDGFVLGMNSTTTWTLHTNPVNNFATQCVAVSMIGRYQVQARGTGSCS